MNTMSLKNINIDFPFGENSVGDFLRMNQTDKEAIKADLMHLILTNKGERLYLPDFGTNLRRYIFEQNDGLTLESIKDEITEVINKYLPNLKLTNLTVEESMENEYAAVVKLNYTITEEVFETKDFVIIKL